MRYLALGEFFINIGNAILLLAFAKFLYDETGQLWAFSLAFVIEMFLALFIPIGFGRVIDNKGVKPILPWVSAANVAICLSYGVFVSSAELSVVWLLMVSMLLSTVKLIVKLSVFSLTPELSEDAQLEKNNGWLASAFQGGQLLGMALAALLLSNGDQAMVFFVVSGFFLLAFLAYSLAVKGVRGAAEHTGKSQDPLHGLKQLFVVSKTFAPALWCSNLDFALVAMFNLLLAATVANLFANDPLWLSILDGAFAIAALIGGMLVARKWRNSAVADSMRTQGAFLLCMVVVLLPWLKVSLVVCVFAFGLSLSLSTVFWNTRLQRTFPAQYKGTLAGARNLIGSVYIGLCSIVISFFHQMGFSVAIGACIAITSMHLMVLFVWQARQKQQQLNVQSELI